MYRHFSWLLVFCVAVFVVFSAVSCKKRVSEKPQVFDPAVDGVAVRPLEPMDEQLANRINREGPVSATADIIVSDQEYAVEAVSADYPATAEVPMAMPTAVGGGIPTAAPMPTAAPTSAYDDFDTSDFDDSNDI